MTKACLSLMGWEKIAWKAQEWVQISPNEILVVNTWSTLYYNVLLVDFILVHDIPYHWPLLFLLTGDGQKTNINATSEKNRLRKWEDPKL